MSEPNPPKTKTAPPPVLDRTGELLRVAASETAEMLVPTPAVFSTKGKTEPPPPIARVTGPLLALDVPASGLSSTVARPFARSNAKTLRGLREGDDVADVNEESPADRTQPLRREMLAAMLPPSTPPAVEPPREEPVIVPPTLMPTFEDVPGPAADVVPPSERSAACTMEGWGELPSVMVSDSVPSFTAADSTSVGAFLPTPTRTSIPSFSIDVAPVHVPPHPVPYLPAEPAQSYRALPTRSSMSPALAAVISGGLTLCLAAAVMLVLLRVPSAANAFGRPAPQQTCVGSELPSKVEPVSVAAPSAPPVVAAPVVAAPVVAAPIVAAAEPVSSARKPRANAKKSEVVAAAAPSATPAALASAEPPPLPYEPPPAPAITIVPPAPVAAAEPTTGSIVVPSTLLTVMVDGDYKRVQGGRVVVACGRHRVSVGRGTEFVDVPCGGTASLH